MAHEKVFRGVVRMSVNNSHIVHVEIIRLVNRERDKEKREVETERSSKCLKQVC